MLAEVDNYVGVKVETRRRKEGKERETMTECRRKNSSKVAISKVAATRAQHSGKDGWDSRGPEENTGCRQVHCMSGRENRRGELDVLGCRGR
jgi:hypothetical protein